jgi:hypothetical protein
MTYTLWSRDTLVGETDFALMREDRRRLGVFHPAASGMLILPALTDMMPALFGMESYMRSIGFTADEMDRDPDAAFAAFDDSSAGQRVLAAGKQVGDLVLRDASGHRVAFDSILVSDMDRLGELGVDVRPEEEREQLNGEVRDPIRYLISVTLSPASSASAGILA